MSTDAASLFQWLPMLTVVVNVSLLPTFHWEAKWWTKDNSGLSSWKLEVKSRVVTLMGVSCLKDSTCPMTVEFLTRVLFNKFVICYWSSNFKLRWNSNFEITLFFCLSFRRKSSNFRQIPKTPKPRLALKPRQKKADK